MGMLDKLLGRDDEPKVEQRPASRHAAQSADEQAIGRYRYMLQTAPPQTIEQAHEEAFAKLTPEQRRLLLHQLAAELPESERSVAAGTLKDDPRSLSRLATRAEFRQPDTLERSFNGMGGRGGMGGMMAGSFLASMAGVVVGSAIAQSFFDGAGTGDAVGGDMANDTAGNAGSDVADAGDVGDFGGGDFGEI